ncbi:MAG: hypothetical protein QW390_04590 [Candidatus Bathyarchaeia archaeon]
MGRKFRRNRQPSGQRLEKTLKCLKCDKVFPLSEFISHVKTCKSGAKTSSS